MNRFDPTRVLLSPVVILALVAALMVWSGCSEDPPTGDAAGGPASIVAVGNEIADDPILAIQVMPLGSGIVTWYDYHSTPEGNGDRVELIVLLWEQIDGQWVNLGPQPQGIMPDDVRLYFGDPEATGPSTHLCDTDYLVSTAWQWNIWPHNGRYYFVFPQGPLAMRGNLGSTDYYVSLFYQGAWRKIIPCTIFDADCTKASSFLVWRNPDLNGDGVVNLSDAGMHTLDRVNQNLRSDFNLDDVVNLSDAGIMSNTLGENCGN